MEYNWIFILTNAFINISIAAGLKLQVFMNQNLRDLMSYYWAHNRHDDYKQLSFILSIRSLFNNNYSPIKRMEHQGFTLSYI